MPRVVHFEIHAEDPERALTFYQKVFGWDFQKWAGPMDYWLIKTGAEGERGINGGMVRRMGAAPVEGQAVNSYVCTVDVPAIDDFIAKAADAGAVIALPKMPIPGVGWLAYVKDTEGNILGLMQADANAK
jgi:predicted enzyme related to lactoylglutathione lyase